jgi:hypothetical protein
MNMPMPPLHDTPAQLQRRRKAARDAQNQPRFHALSRVQPQQARTRRQVARLLGVNRDPGGRGLAAYAQGGIPQLVMLAKALGKPPLRAEAIRPARRAR